MNNNIVIKYKTGKKLVILILIEAVLFISEVLIPANFFSNQILIKSCFAGVELLILLALFTTIKNEILNPVKKLTDASRSLSDGIVDNHIFNFNNELKELSDNLNEIDQKISNATLFAQHIGDGNFETQLSDEREEFGLGKALLDMRDKLRDVADEEKKRNWSVEGIAKFSHILRDNLDTDLKELSYLIISNLVKYLKSNQGGIFLINDYDSSDVYIELMGCYAYEKKKFEEVRLELKEGLIGQSIMERNTIYLTSVPGKYARITSGLGEATPRSVLIIPIKVNESIYGAIELASFELFQKFEIEFIQNIAESFGSNLSSMKSNLNTQRLLKESEKIADELRTKENALVQNEEELTAAQEDLSNKLIELQAETNLTKCILEAINKSNACIEFDMDGNILNSNAMFLSVMGFDKDELVGQEERIMVPQDELNSQRYQLLWDSLKKGNFNTGEFRRISKNGKEIWIEATYNPILDLKGSPYKILMFANFTTESKEKENEYRNRINAINEAFVFIDLNADFTIRSVNQIFVNKLKFKRKEVKSMSFLEMIQNPYNQIDNILEVQKEIEAGVVNKQLTLISSEGVPIKFLTTLSASRDIAGKLINYFAILVHPNE